MCIDSEEWCKSWRGIDLLFQNWDEEFHEFWCEHLKVSEVWTLMGSLWPRYIMFKLKSTKELSFMTLRSDAKFGPKLICGLENDMGNFENFCQSTGQCQNWDFDGILLFKAENAWAKILQKIYVNWRWRMMQNLKRNWVVVSKLAWGISQILIRPLERLKSLHFNSAPYDQSI